MQIPRKTDGFQGNSVIVVIEEVNFSWIVKEEILLVTIIRTVFLDVIFLAVIKTISENL